MRCGGSTADRLSGSFGLWRVGPWPDTVPRVCEWSAATHGYVHCGCRCGCRCALSLEVTLSCTGWYDESGGGVCELLAVKRSAYVVPARAALERAPGPLSPPRDCTERMLMGAEGRSRRRR